MADWTQPTQTNPGDVFTSAIWNVVANDVPFFDWKVTSKAVNTTVTETDLFNSEITVPAAAMGSNERLLGWASIDIKNNTGAATDSPRFKLKLDSTTLIDTGAIGGTPIAASATRGTGMIFFEIQEMGATNAQEISLWGWYASGTLVNFTTGSGIHRTTGTSDGQRLYGRNATTVDMTASRTLALTVINPSANALWETALYAGKVAIGA